MEKTQEKVVLYFPYNLDDEEVKKIKESIEIVDDDEVNEERSIVKVYKKFPLCSPIEVADLFLYSHHELTKCRNNEKINEGLEDIEKKIDVSELNLLVSKYKRISLTPTGIIFLNEIEGILNKSKKLVDGLIDFMMSICSEKKKEAKPQGGIGVVQEVLDKHRGKTNEANKKAGAG